MKTNGIFVVSAWIEGGEIIAPFIVCETLNADAIIGMNIIRRFGLYPTPQGRVAFIRECASVTPELGKEAGFLIATKAVTVAPFQARRIRTQLRDSKFALVKRKTDIIGNQNDLEFAQTTSAEGICEIFVRNPSPFEWKVQRGEIVATAETMTECIQVTKAELAALSKDIFNKDKKLRAAQAAPPPTGPKINGAVRKSVNEQIERTVQAFPAHVRDKARQTFRKYQSVFSTSKTDLGEEPTTEHEIHLRSEEPAYA